VVTPISAHRAGNPRKRAKRRFAPSVVRTGNIPTRTSFYFPKGRAQRSCPSKSDHGAQPFHEPEARARAVTAQARLMVVEDDKEMRDLLVQYLSLDGHDVEAVGDSAAAISAISRQEPDLMLLDIVLGNEDGRDLLRELRRMSGVPVVFLTGRGHEIDKIAGLKMGADDYIVKPFSHGELSARVESLLRRSRRPMRPSGITDFDGLRIDFVAREVEVRGRVVELTPKEYETLAFLASSPRRAYTRGQLLTNVWSSSAEWQGEATVTEHIRRLRRKIELDPDHPQWITTVRGVGYRFEPSRSGDRGSS
jgi:two-component system, OmpR family, phosphate regulon response regulator PhoB